MKVLEENRGSTLFDITLAIFFLDLSPQAREPKAKINKWDCTKLQTFCMVKETINKMKEKPTEWRRYLQTIHLICINTQNILRTHKTQHQKSTKT